MIEDADSALPDALRPFLAEVCDEIGEMQARISQVARQLEALARQTPVVQRLRSIPRSAVDLHRARRRWFRCAK